MRKNKSIITWINEKILNMSNSSVLLLSVAAVAVIAAVWAALERHFVNLHYFGDGELNDMLILILFAGFGIIILLGPVKYIICTCIYKIAVNRSYALDRLKYHMGMFRLILAFWHADENLLDTSIFPVSPWRQLRGIIFGCDSSGRIVGINTDAEANIIVNGQPGSGKTSGAVIPAAVCFGGSVIAVDIKGDIYNYAGRTDRKIMRFCPDHPDALSESAHFDPFAAIRGMNPAEEKIYLNNLAEILIPPSDKGGDSAEYFEGVARNFFIGIVYLLLYQDENTSFPTVVHEILAGNCMGWIDRVEKSGCREAQEKILSYKGNNEKNISGGYKRLTDAVDPFATPILDELLTDDGSDDFPVLSMNTIDAGLDIYLQCNQDNLIYYAPILTMVMQSFMAGFYRRPDCSTGEDVRPVLMILDEFPQLTFPAQMVDSALSTLRSKGVKIMLVAQTRRQIDNKYGRDEAAAIYSLCNYQVYLGCNDGEDRITISKSFGERKTLVQTDSNDGREMYQHGKEPVYSPELIAALPSRKQLVVYYNGEHALLDRINCYDG